MIKYGDNILKNFTTSCSVILGTLVSVVLFDFQLSFQFAWCGTHIEHRCMQPTPCRYRSFQLVRCGAPPSPLPLLRRGSAFVVLAAYLYTTTGAAAAATKPAAETKPLAPAEEEAAEAGAGARAVG